MRKYRVILDATTKIEFETIEAEGFPIETQGSSQNPCYFYTFMSRGTIVACIPVNRVVAAIDVSVRS